MAVSSPIFDKIPIRTGLTERKAPRIERLKKRYYTDPFHVDSQRALLVTESYRQTEGQPIVIRRAKALEKILGNIDIHILPDELIVGVQNGISPRSAKLLVRSRGVVGNAG